MPSSPVDGHAPHGAVGAAEGAQEANAMSRNDPTSFSGGSDKLRSAAEDGKRDRLSSTLAESDIRPENVIPASNAVPADGARDNQLGGKERAVGVDGDRATSIDGDVERQATQSHEKTKEDEDEPYSIFTRKETWMIIIIITLAGFFSPLTANIYLPAIPQISSDLQVTTEAVQLSVTVFMIFQGISPLFFGSMTDTLGRRPIYIICLVLYVASNIGLWLLPDVGPNHSSSDVYAGLMVLRALQASGSASVISIGSGSIGDITLPANRGGVMGVFQSGTSVGPSLGPVLGGALTSRFGWRSIFLFLFILAVICLVLLILFLPETLRRLVGNGSKPPPTIFHEALYMVVTKQTSTQRTGVPRPGFRTLQKEADEEKGNRWVRVLLQPLGPLRFLAIPEVLCVLLANAAVYTSYYTVTSTLAYAFQTRYGFTTLQGSLVFLSPGLGTSIAAFTSGKLLDRSYKAVKRQVEQKEKDKLEGIVREGPIKRTFSQLSRTLSRKQTGRAAVAQEDSAGATHTSDQNLRLKHLSPTSTVPKEAHATHLEQTTPQESIDSGTTYESVRGTAVSVAPTPKRDAGNDISDFPIESARLRTYVPMMGLLVSSLIGYAWTLEKVVHPSAPIIFVFLIGYAVGTSFSIFGCILVDYLPGKGASVTAANNFVRCLCGAAGTAVIQFIYDALGPGLTFTIIAIATLASSPLALLVYIKGPQWRKARSQR